MNNIFLILSKFIQIFKNAVCFILVFIFRKYDIVYSRFNTKLDLNCAVIEFICHLPHNSAEYLNIIMQSINYASVSSFNG